MVGDVPRIESVQESVNMLKQHCSSVFQQKGVDLESAYEQLPVRPSHAHLSICAMKNPESGAVEFFELHELPFGASAAVHGFNRAAMELGARVEPANVYDRQASVLPALQLLHGKSVATKVHIGLDPICGLRS